MDTGGPSTSSGTPVAEFKIDSALVSALLALQHPDLAQLPLEPADVGWDNAMFRLGDRLAVRLPRRAAAASLILHEQTWLPRLANQLSLPIPVPYRIGTPALGYPCHWSVLPWLRGTPADLNEPDASQALPFGNFLRSLHVSAPEDAPVNPVRGGPLTQRAAVVEERLHRVAMKTPLITSGIRRIWDTALSEPLDVPPRWLHGDLHSRNVLVDQGQISGIIDWGDITAGDPATDLASLWMLFAKPAARYAALSAYHDVSEATLRRARGWALLFGSVLLDSGLVDNPRNAAIGAHTLRRLAEPL